MSKAKEAAGRRAAESVEDGMTLGLGTGSTVYFTLVRIAERIREEGLSLRGVPTSLDTEDKARALGIPLVSLGEVERFDLTIDGADEIDPAFDMIKGGGGALLREKVVASMSEQVIIVVGPDKLVDRLGTSFALPVEVVPFAVPRVAAVLASLGAEPVLRTKAGAAFVTDNHNHILDARFATGIEDPVALEQALALTPGAVESGLFIHLAHRLVIGHADGRVELRARPPGSA